MGAGFVPFTFADQAGPIPLAELDANLSYISDKVIEVTDFGAVGDGIHDDTNAFIDALNSEPFIGIPAGRWMIETAAIALQGGKLIGCGATACTVVITNASLPGITINAHINNAEIAGFTLDRNIAATLGGNGIDTSTVTIGQSQIHDMQLRNHYNNLALGPTDYGLVYRVLSELAYNNGFFQTNTAGDGAVQWNYSDTLAQKCNLHAYLIQTIAGPVHMTVGDMINIRAFACSGRGLIALGLPGVPLEGLRVRGAFVGENGESGVYCDTYGSEIALANVFSELAGTSGTGRTLATAPSGVGAGIEITGNNGVTQITSPQCVANCYDGVYAAGTYNTVSNPTCRNNGISLAVGRRGGLNFAAGTSSVVGGFSGNTNGGTTQQYGMIAADGNNVTRSGIIYAGNFTADENILANATGLSGSGNLPNSTPVNISPAGSVIVGNPTGGFIGGGTINVDTGLLLDNVAYTNP